MKDIVFSGSLKNFVKNDTLQVSWNLFEECNYNCYYCGTKQGRYCKDAGNYLTPDGKCNSWDMDKNLIENVITGIAEEKHKKIDFTISGGEPSILKEDTFLFLLNQMKDKLSDSLITIRYMTNLSNDVSYYKNIWSILKEKNILLCTTIHYLMGLKTFEKKINKLINEPIIIDLRVPISCKYLTESLKRYNYLKKLAGDNIFVIPKYIMEYECGIDNTVLKWLLNENEKIVKKQPDMMTFDTVFFDGINFTLEKHNRDIYSQYYKQKIKWVCDLSKNKFIDFKGRTWKCINDSNQNKFSKRDRVICSNSMCSCGQYIPKMNLKYFGNSNLIKNMYDGS